MRGVSNTLKPMPRSTGGQDTSLAVAVQKQVAAAVSDPQSRQRFTSTIMQLINTTESLKMCNLATVVAAALRGEGMGLIHGHGYYVVPYGDTATFIMGYKGYIALAIATGQYRDIDCREVREGEYLGRDPRTGRPDIDFSLYTDDADRESRKIIGYYAYFELNNGMFKGEYWSMAKLMQHAIRHVPSFNAALFDKLTSGEELTDAEARKARNGSPWYDISGGGTEIMCKKTALRSLLNSGYAPLNPEVRYIIGNDADVAFMDVPAAIQPPKDADPLLNPGGKADERPAGEYRQAVVKEGPAQA